MKKKVKTGKTLEIITAACMCAFTLDIFVSVHEVTRTFLTPV